MNSQNKVNRESAAIVCGHIADSDDPTIRHAQRDVPEEPADSGWQFLCGAESEDWAEARVWSVDEVLQIAPDLAQFIDCPPGTVLTRSGPEDAWNCKQMEPEGTKGDGGN